jgi:hypothetical protein
MLNFYRFSHVLARKILFASITIGDTIKKEL